MPRGILRMRLLPMLLIVLSCLLPVFGQEDELPSKLNDSVIAKLRSTIINVKSESDTLESIVRRITEQADIDLVITDDVRSKAAGVLDKPTRASSSGGDAQQTLQFFLTPTPLYHEIENGKLYIRTIQQHSEEAKATVENGKDESTDTDENKARVVVVAKFIRAEGIGYSGIRGATFTFEIVKVLRFEKDKRPPTVEALRRLSEGEFNEMLKRNMKLKSNNLMDWSIEYLESSSEKAAAPTKIKDISNLCKPGELYIIGIHSSTNVTAMTGMIRPNKWGSVRGIDVTVLEYTEDALEKLDEHLLRGTAPAKAERQVYAIEFTKKIYEERPKNVEPVSGDRPHRLERWILDPVSNRPRAMTPTERKKYPTAKDLAHPSNLSPNGEKMVISRKTESGGINLHLIDMKSKSITRLSSKKRQETSAVFTPQGKILFLAKDFETDGPFANIGTAPKATELREVDEQGNDTPRLPPPIQSSTPTEVTEIDVEGNGERVLISTYRYMFDGVLCPDARRLAYTDGGPYIVDVYLLDLHKKTSRLVAGDAYGPRWIRFSIPHEAK